MAGALKIDWVCVLVAGMLAELLLFAVVFLTLHFFGQRAFLATILIASAVMPCRLALWVGRHIESGFLLHGAPVGVVATLRFVALAWGHPEPLLDKVAHGLKVVGGMAGGVVASRREPVEGDAWRPMRSRP